MDTMLNPEHVKVRVHNAKLAYTIKVRSIVLVVRVDYITIRVHAMPLIIVQAKTNITIKLILFAKYPVRLELIRMFTIPILLLEDLLVLRLQ